MALIECKDCGKDISSSAANCPNCGAPISGKPLALMDGKVKFILSWVFGILLLFSGLGNIFKDGNLYGVVFILMALILLPPSVKVIEEAIGFELTLKAKGFILGGLCHQLQRRQLNLLVLAVFQDMIVIPSEISKCPIFISRFQVKQTCKKTLISTQKKGIVSSGKVRC